MASINLPITRGVDINQEIYVSPIAKALSAMYQAQANQRAQEASERAQQELELQKQRTASEIALHDVGIQHTKAQMEQIKADKALAEWEAQFKYANLPIPGQRPQTGPNQPTPTPITSGLGPGGSGDVTAAGKPTQIPPAGIPPVMTPQPTPAPTEYTDLPALIDPATGRVRMPAQHVPKLYQSDVAQMEILKKVAEERARYQAEAEFKPDEWAAAPGFLGIPEYYKKRGGPQGGGGPTGAPASAFDFGGGPAAPAGPGGPTPTGGPQRSGGINPNMPVPGGGGMTLKDYFPTRTDPYTGAKYYDARDAPKGEEKQMAHMARLAGRPWIEPKAAESLDAVRTAQQDLESAWQAVKNQFSGNMGGVLVNKALSALQFGDKGAALQAFQREIQGASIRLARAEGGTTGLRLQQKLLEIMREAIANPTKVTAKTAEDMVGLSREFLGNVSKTALGIGVRDAQAPAPDENGVIDYGDVVATPLQRR